MKDKPLLHIVILFSIILLGFFLRTYKLSDIPSGFFADEASIGYNAYAILTTGKDEYRMHFPIFFQSFGDYRPPLAVYSAIPFISFLGLNELSIRLPSVFYGLITIMVMYFLGKEIMSKSFGLLTAFIATTMPWLIHYNRTGFEFTIYTTFFVTTVLLFLKATHSKNFIIPAFIIASLTLYTYQPARLLIPLLLIGVFLIYRKIYLVHKKEAISGLVVFFVLSLPMVLSLLSGEGTARFTMVSVFSAKLSFTQTALRVIYNYFSQLSPSLFISGEPTFISRHFVGGLTPLLISTLPFLVLGLIHIILAIKEKSSQILMCWLLIYPIAGAITTDPPFTSRSIIGAPLFVLFISFGIVATIHYFKKIINKHILVIIAITTIIINLIFFTKFYFVQYPLYSSDFWGWQYGARDIIQYFLIKEKNYDELIMEPAFNAPEIFFKFYAPNRCRKCKIGTPENSYKSALKQLFAVTPTTLAHYPDLRFTTRKTLYYPNNTIAFQIGEIVE